MRTVQLEDFPTDTLRVGAEVNILVGDGDPGLINCLFQPVREEDWDPDEILVRTDPDITWPHLLAALDCFPSISQARKNWRGGAKEAMPIEGGYQEVTIGKARKIRIFLWKPIPVEDF